MFAVEFIAVKQPIGLLWRQSHFLAFFAGAFFLALLLALRLIFVLVVVSSRARGHVWSRDPAFELAQFFLKIVAFVAHGGSHLLHFPNAVDQLGNVTVDRIGVLLGIEVLGIQLNGTLKVARGSLPFFETSALGLESIANSLDRGFELSARAAAPYVGSHHLLNIVASKSIIGVTNCVLGTLRRRLATAAGRPGRRT